MLPWQGKGVRAEHQESCMVLQCAFVYLLIEILAQVGIGSTYLTVVCACIVCVK